MAKKSSPPKGRSLAQRMKDRAKDLDAATDRQVRGKNSNPKPKAKKKK